MIELVNVKQKRGNDQFNIQIKPGSMICITGDYRNHLLRILAGLDMPYEGNVVVNNKNIVQMKEDARTNFRRRYISYLYNSDNLINHLSVKDNIILVNQLDGESVDSNKFLKVLDQLHISKDMLELYPSALSTLQKFIVALARGLVSNHQFFFVEDLDLIQNIRYIEDYLITLKIINQTNNITVVVTLANSKEWFSIFDQKITC
jgi:ABC-type lipoprotein export system ATPase subunit